jgi:thymidylate kinase
MHDMNVYAIEGLDRLGKSTLIKNIKDKLGFFQVIHFSKPERLKAYGHLNSESNGDLYRYQLESFNNSMIMAKSGSKLIFDRWHLGEAVYANLYRKYNGEYVFDLEKKHDMECHSRNISLILLTEDFSRSKHFEDDGDSFDVTKRQDEQELFIRAWKKSSISNKKMVCVTELSTGKFKSEMQILNEVLN